MARVVERSVFRFAQARRKAAAFYVNRIGNLWKSILNTTVNGGVWSLMYFGLISTIPGTCIIVGYLVFDQVFLTPREFHSTIPTNSLFLPNDATYITKPTIIVNPFQPMNYDPYPFNPFIYKK